MGEEVEKLERVLWRLSRLADGEHAKTVYALPPGGSYDPLRRDIMALIGAFMARLPALSAPAEERKGDGLQTNGEKHCADPQEVQHQPSREDLITILHELAIRAKNRIGTPRRDDLAIERTADHIAAHYACAATAKAEESA